MGGLTGAGLGAGGTGEGMGDGVGTGTAVGDPIWIISGRDTGDEGSGSGTFWGHGFSQGPMSRPEVGEQ